MIIDISCQSSTELFNGLASVRGNSAIIFNQALTNYGVCAHKIGHTLGLIHAFYDNNSDKEVSDKEIFQIHPWCINI